MNKNQTGIAKRFVAAMLVTAAVVGVSILSMHTPTDNRMARPLKNIQTDKATLFYAGPGPSSPGGSNCVELVLPSTRESKASIENLKLIAAAF
jgi:hypothetical protein